MGIVQKPYQRINKLLEQEAFEPVISWGLRMAIAAMLPVLWGVYTNRLQEAIWITLAAECICWVELKGSFGQRLRILTGGIVLVVVFGLLGSITANYIWISLACMLIVGFISGLFKNLGDRGSGLAICVYVIFIITNAYPIQSKPELSHRIELLFIGGLWNALAGILAALYTPAKQPYRRTVAVIWKHTAQLTDAVARGWDGKTTRSSMRDIYLKEKEVRASIDTSLHLYETQAHLANKKDIHEFELAQVRKSTALIASHIIAISEELEQVNILETASTLRLKLYAMLKALQQTADRMATFIATLKPEDELLLSSRISRLEKLTILLKDYATEQNTSLSSPIARTIQLTERCTKLIQNAVSRLKELETDKSVFRSYSLIKTVFILHPKHWVRNLKLLFNFNTFTTRYAIRTAIAATIALFIDKWFNIDHGYWIPFTVILVSQPYFGATLQKATDRVIGTLLGGIAGGILLRIPEGMYAKELMLFISFVLMVYFLHKRYSVAVFFITLSLVLLFDVEESLNPSLLFVRALSTTSGALLAIIAGFALLPHWDTKWLPINLAESFNANYRYFIATFFSEKPIGNWTRLKRQAESKNSNAFDSFNRYMQEPSLKSKPYAIYYHLITHNVRITRELNNIHLEFETTEKNTNPISIEQQLKLVMALDWLNKNMIIAQRINIYNKTVITETRSMPHYPYELSAHQLLYIDRMIIELKAMYTDMQKLAHHEYE